MKKCRLYIADMDVQFISGVRRVVTRCQGIEIVGSSGNGRTALRDCLRLQPDVVISDIPLPELDGISLLHEFQRFGHAPAVIVCTRFYSNASMQCACRYGASFFLCKELISGYLKGITGEYATPQGYFVDEAESEEFDKMFPHKEKLVLPGQLF